MPLNIAALQSGLQSVAADPPLVMAGDTADATATRAQCAQAWADAVQAWAAGIVPPSTTVAAAAATLSTALASAFAAPDAAPAMEGAFAAFAATVGGGMAGYAPVPPVAPVGFAPQFGQPHPSTHADAATAVATIIDTWMRTGVSTLVAPPNTPVPWS